MGLQTVLLTRRFFIFTPENIIYNLFLNKKGPNFSEPTKSHSHTITFWEFIILFKRNYILWETVDDMRFLQKQK